MIEHIVLGVVLVLALGSTAQWLAWRFNIPSILLLLIFGFIAGPILKILPPESLNEEWVYAFVSLSIGIILFEGGLSLQISELREAGKAIRNLITVGVLATWFLIATTAYYVLEFRLDLSILIGAILTVTGPTVVIPLLRQVRTRGRAGVIARWEGITIDPIGAILAVLVLEVIILLHETTETRDSIWEILGHTVGGLLSTIAVGIVMSLFGAMLLILLLHRRLVPDYLQGTVALVVVVVTFALANVLQEESGLLEVTLLGIIMANQKYVPVRRISEFKENLQVLLIGSLFIVLSAKLELEVVEQIDVRTLVFLLILILIVRPVAVYLSTLKTDLDWREKTFLACLAPRGIVAAAVASLFAFRLEGLLDTSEIVSLVPTVFVVIVGTVAVYGLSLSPLSKSLGLAEPNAQGLLFVGGHPWALHLAKAVQELGFNVRVADTNARNIEQAQKRGIPSDRMNVFSESAVDEMDLTGIGKLIALTQNDEVNSLAALRFSEVFDSSSVYQLPMMASGTERRGVDVPMHLRGRTLFGEKAYYQLLSERFAEGDDIETFRLSEENTYESLNERYGDDLILLFVVRGRELLVQSTETVLNPVPGDTVVVLTPRGTSLTHVREETPFERLIADALVIDLDRCGSFHQVIEKASTALGKQSSLPANSLRRDFHESWRSRMMLVVNGVALPHSRLPDIAQPLMVLVRCRAGINIDILEGGKIQMKRVYAIFFLVSDEGNPGQHLRILANISGRIDRPSFMVKWRTATDERGLKEAMLQEERYISIQVGYDAPALDFVNHQVGSLPLPENCSVMLISRDNEIIRPTADFVLKEGDQLIIVGNPSSITELREGMVHQQ